MHRRAAEVAQELDARDAPEREETEESVVP
jgi:hypothetical protein